MVHASRGPDSNIGRLPPLFAQKIDDKVIALRKYQNVFDDGGEVDSVVATRYSASAS
jgi:hypothetical protein